MHYARAVDVAVGQEAWTVTPLPPAYPTRLEVTDGRETVILPLSGLYAPPSWELVPDGPRSEAVPASGGGVATRDAPDGHVWRMACPRCGRHRYAKSNSRHQIEWCRVCTHELRLARRRAAPKRETVSIALPRSLYESLLERAPERTRAGVEALVERLLR